MSDFYRIKQKLSWIPKDSIVKLEDTDKHTLICPVDPRSKTILEQQDIKHIFVNKKDRASIEKVLDKVTDPEAIAVLYDQ